MSWEIRLESARFYAFHGVFPEEQVAGNWFEVSVVVQSATIPPVPELLAQTLDYGVLYQVTKEEMSQQEALIETVAGKIGQRLMNVHPIINRVEVDIRKIAPGLGGALASTAVKAIFPVSSQQ